MQRILVVSDSHGKNENVKAAVEKAGKIHAMIHLGDVGTSYNEVLRMAGVSAYIVRGNCDASYELKERNIIRIGAHSIYATHGHRQNVQYGLDTLRYVAMQNGCDIALYGHTHVPYIDKGEDVSFMNPGSVSLPRQTGHAKTYGIITIEDDGLVRFEICEM